MGGGKCHQSSSGWFCCAATTSCRGILIIIIMMLTIVFLCLVSLQHPAQTEPKARYKWSCCCHSSCTGWAITSATAEHQTDLPVFALGSCQLPQLSPEGTSSPGHSLAGLALSLTTRDFAHPPSMCCSSSRWVTLVDTSLTLPLLFGPSHMIY